MKARYACLAGVLLALDCGSSAAHELAVDFILGGDSNPNRLADVFEVDTEAYTLGRVRFRHESAGTGFHYQIDGRNDLYTRDDEGVTNAANAEEIRLSVIGGFTWAPALAHGPANFTADIFYRRRDAIFVDRITGGVATFSGTMIDNRFDAEEAGFQLSGDVPLSAAANFLFSLRSFDKKYESYVELGLANLDYQQTRVNLGFEKQMGARTRVRTIIGTGTRRYVDRRAREEDGVLLADSDLEFTLFGVTGMLDIQLGDRWNWQVGAEVDQRKDNESGYYDLTEASAFSQLRYRNEHFVNFLFTAAYLNRELDNIDDNAIMTLEEEEKEKDGYRIGTELVRNVTDWLNYDVDLILGLNYESFGHDNLFYNYDRSQFYIGARWRAY